MYVTKRDGRTEEVNLDKILNSVARICEDFDDVDTYKIALRTVGGLYDGVTTAELDQLSIQTAVGFIAEDPIYSKVAARLLSNYISKEVQNQDIHSFSQSAQISYDQGLLAEKTYTFIMENKRKLNNAVKSERNDLFEYYGLRIVYDRYLLKHPTKRNVIESPQDWLLRVACGLSDSIKEVMELYTLISKHEYMLSTPTLFNSGTNHPQMSSCYLLDSPMDDLRDIEKRRMDVALLSKWAGGIGLSFSRVRGSGALIKGTNGKSNGIVPFLHSLDANVSAVNQGGKRKGAACVYLETHHPDIMEFLELRDNTGDSEKRTYNLNLANWIPDLFMKRGKDDALWSLFDPSDAPELTDMFGEEYEKRYLELEEEEKYVKQIPAQKIYSRMMRTLAETGNGWMTFKDLCNTRCNSAVAGNIVHSSNLCTEIVEPTYAGKYNSHTYKSLMKNGINANVIGLDGDTGELKTIDDAEVAVCNLASINLSKYVKDGKVDKMKLRRTVSVAIKFLDKVIDKNFYPVHEAKASNSRWRPVGLGLMGWQDMLFQLRLPFESEEAIELSRMIQEEIYYAALKTSCELAQELGTHKDYEFTHAANGKLQFDLAGHEPQNTKRWAELKESIKEHGLRNSLLIAIAPTATISSIVGVYECIEPQISNLFKRETLSGEFVQTNRYLVHDLKELGLWSVEMMEKIKANDGSVQGIFEIPEDIRNLYKTVWEVKQKSIIDHSVGRGCFVDQAQSTNLFISDPTIEKLSSMYMYTWEQGLKTTYYLRSKSKTKISQVKNAEHALKSEGGPSLTTSDDPIDERLEHDLENPEPCESCT